MTGEKAVLVDSGSFRVDRKRALDKLMNFQLPDPRMYPLALVQAAVAGGATRVRIDLHFTNTVFLFDGAPWSEDELRQPYECLFAGKSGPRTARDRNLAIALLTALRLKPRAIEVVCVSGGTRRTLRVKSLTEDEVLCEAAPAGTQDGCSVIVYDSDFSRESAYLRRHCAWACVPIEIDGKPLETGASGGDDALSFDEDGVSGKLWLADPQRARSRIELLTHGVAVCTEEPILPTVQVEGFVRDDRFRKNISQTAVVKDERHRKAMSAAASHARALMLKAIEAVGDLAPAVGPDIASDSYLRRHWISQESPAVLQSLQGLFRRDEGSRRKAKTVARASGMVQALRRVCARDRGEVSKAERGALAALWDCPLLFDPAGRPLSLAALDAQRKVLGHVPFSSRWDPYPVRGGLAAWAPRSGDKAFLDAMFPGRTWPVRTGWSEDRIDLSRILDDGDKTLVRAAVEGFSAEAALCATFRGDGTRIRWLLEGREPAVSLADTGSLRMDVVVELPGRDAPPADGSPEAAALLAAVLRKAPELYKVLLDAFLKHARPGDETPYSAAYHRGAKESAPVLQPAQRAAILEHLLDFAADAWEKEGLPPADPGDGLQRAPIFRTIQGAPFSLSELRELREKDVRVALLSCSQPEELRYLVRERPDRVSPLFAGTALVSEVVKVDLSVCRAPKVRREPAEAAAPAAPPPKKGVSEEEWLAALKKCFVDLYEAKAVPAELAELGQLSFAERSGRSGLIWRGRNGAWTLDPEHPAVRTLMSAPDLSSGLPYLASLVFSAANRHRLEVTDEQDSLFQTALVSRASGMPQPQASGPLRSP